LATTTSNATLLTVCNARRQSFWPLQMNFHTGNQQAKVANEKQDIAFSKQSHDHTPSG